MALYLRLLKSCVGKHGKAGLPLSKKEKDVAPRATEARSNGGPYREYRGGQSTSSVLYLTAVLCLLLTNR